jgi:hypothetical protein
MEEAQLLSSYESNGGGTFQDDPIQFTHTGTTRGAGHIHAESDVHDVLRRDSTPDEIDLTLDDLMPHEDTLRRRT